MKFKQLKMTVKRNPVGEKDGGGKCVLVGLQINGNGREVLNWALSKVAKHGDRVVAVHVCSDIFDTEMVPLIRMLDEYLSVYKGLCSMKQVVLVGRITQGSSVRRVLVREAEICGAATVVVGVSKNSSFRSSTSLAKYCAKKLPSTTALIALHDGRTTFERGATKLPSGGEPRLILRTILHPSVGMDPKVIVPSRETMSDIVTPRLSDISYGDSLKGEFPDGHHLVHERVARADSSSISVLVRELPDTPGWPLLRRASSASPKSPKDSEARKMSVVQWAMSLPDRSLPLIEYHIDKEDTSPSAGISKKLERILKENSSGCKWFSYEELQSSTSQFSAENIIGKGGSSQVYKANLPSGEQVAIKVSKLSEEAARGFLLEVDIITMLQHKHIVPLIGVCIEECNIIFVYPYFSKGSLEENLHGKKAKAPLSWGTRFKVAIRIAEALCYLHDGCSRSVIHRDVKSANILLSDELEPQLSDFNLALWAPTATSHLTYSDVVGTFGYLAPEYFMYGRVSHKIDVYAYGVILLELLTGRKAISDDAPKGQESLVMWATQTLEKGNVMDILDPNLEGKYDEDQMRRMVLVASLCIGRAARLRPPMSEILCLLQNEEYVAAWMNFSTTDTLNDQDDEAYPASSIGSHLGLALLDVDDDVSVTSFEQNHLNYLEEYLRGRWSRSSSFD